MTKDEAYEVIDESIGSTLCLDCPYYIVGHDKSQMINMKLANKLGLSDRRVGEINFWQKYRKGLGIQYTERTISAATYKEFWEQNEYRLQELWGFPKDPNYHKFWEMSGCTCPKIDNEDSYPTGFYIHTQNCPLHGVVV